MCGQLAGHAWSVGGHAWSVCGQLGGQTDKAMAGPLVLLLHSKHVINCKLV